MKLKPGPSDPGNNLSEVSAERGKVNRLPGYGTPAENHEAGWGPGPRRSGGSLVFVSSVERLTDVANLGIGSE